MIIIKKVLILDLVEIIQEDYIPDDININNLNLNIINFIYF